MARQFNLQPWRAARRAQVKKNFTITTFCIALVCVVVLYGYKMLQEHFIAEQNSAIRNLNTHIAQLKKAENEVKRSQALSEEVQKQIRVIEGLEAQRGVTVQMLDFLAKETPPSIFLQSLTYRDGMLHISGIAQSETGVSDYIRQLKKFPYFSVVHWEGMRQAKSNARFKVSETTEVRSFDLSVQVNPDGKDKS